MQLKKLFSLTTTIILWFSLSACSSSNSETVEDVMDDSSDNQVTAPAEVAETVEGEIPTPEAVTQELANANADEGKNPTAPDAEQKEIDSIMAAETSGDHQLSKAPSARSASVDVASTEGTGIEENQVGAPSLASIAAEGSHQKGKTSKARAAHKSRDHISKNRTSKPLSQANPQEGARESLAANEGSSKTYIVKPGDTLSLISFVLYGTSNRWNELAQVNNLSRESPIFPGDALKYTIDQKSATFEPQWEGLPKQTITIAKGDTLESIAARIMGNKNYWKLLWRWNEASMSDPHKIAPGQSLRYVTTQELTAFYTERKKSDLSH